MCVCFFFFFLALRQPRVLKMKKSPEKDFPGGPVIENPTANAGHMALIPGLVKFHMPWGN